jgi:predicted RNA binding protein YcfA (HicA-like mRNA interferase family)
MGKKIKPVSQATHYGEIVDYIEYYGGEESRCCGDHRTYDLPHGHHVTLSYKRRSEEVSKGTRGSIIRTLRMAGIPIITIILLYWTYLIWG